MTFKSTLAVILVACACTTTVQQTAPPLNEFDVIALEHADAAALATLLGNFVRSASEGSLEGSTVNIFGDERTNSLLVTAPSARMAEIRTLVETLDVDQTRPGG